MLQSPIPEELCPSGQKTPANPGFGTVIMGGYFKPLRRKAGVVTLLMACVFAAGWVRSRTIADAIEMNRVEIVSSQGSILVISSSGEAFHFPAWEAAEPVDLDEEIGLETKWAFRFCGLGYTKTEDRDQFMLLPYWSLVIPLALLSAYLLLSKHNPTSRRNNGKNLEDSPSLPARLTDVPL